MLLLDWRSKQESFFLLLLLQHMFSADNVTDMLEIAGVNSCMHAMPNVKLFIEVFLESLLMSDR